MQSTPLFIVGSDPSQSQVGKALKAFKCQQLMLGFKVGLL